MSEYQDVAEEVILQAKEGDKLAQGKIVKQYEHMVYNIALRLMGNAEDAEGVMQETFIKVLDALPSFRGDSKLSTWIYRIAANFAMMELRKRKRIFLSLDDYTFNENRDFASFTRSITENPETLLQNNELREVMDEAIEELPPKYKTAFVMKDLQGLSLKQVAKILDMNIATVKTHVRRARLFLRDKLTDYVHEAEK